MRYFVTDIATFFSPCVNLPNFLLFREEILKRNFQKVRNLKHILSDTNLVEGKLAVLCLHLLHVKVVDVVDDLQVPVQQQ